MEGDARDAPVLSLPGELEVLHVHGILAAREALYGDVAHVFFIFVLVVIDVAVVVAPGFLGLNSIDLIQNASLDISLKMY